MQSAIYDEERTTDEEEIRKRRRRRRMANNAASHLTPTDLLPRGDLVWGRAQDQDDEYPLTTKTEDKINYKEWMDGGKDEIRDGGNTEWKTEEKEKLKSKERYDKDKEGNAKVEEGTTKDDSGVAKSRRKRAASLYWPSGSIFVAEFYFTVPITAPRGVTVPLTVDVPYKFTLPNITSEFLGRRRADVADRLDVYGIVEGLFHRFGMDGRACMLRAVCERAESNLVGGGMLGEVLTTILMASASSSSEELYEYQTAEYYGKEYGDCSSIYPGCPMSIFNWLE